LAKRKLFIYAILRLGFVGRVNFKVGFTIGLLDVWREGGKLGGSFGNFSNVKIPASGRKTRVMSRLKNAKIKIDDRIRNSLRKLLWN
jgi:hypothetical protein